MTEGTVHSYSPIAVSAESTVVAEFVPDAASAAAYQSEADLEREFIRLLQSWTFALWWLCPVGELGPSGFVFLVDTPCSGACSRWCYERIICKLIQCR